LITVKGREILGRADAVVYDFLVAPELLELAPAARKFFVGKRAGEKSSRGQASINRLLARLARAGKSVARLKGGDPFIFGRGGEEALFLSAKRIPFEVVPGVTAALGAAASAGITLTHRGIASQVTLVTAHEDPAKPRSAVNWEALAKGGGTLVFYMGMKTFGRVVKQLTAHGLSQRTPAAVIEWATRPEQKIVAGSISGISRKIRSASISSPALAIVGEAVRLRGKLDWFSRRPLAGKTVLVTRARAQSGVLRRELEALGARVLELPAIRILPLPAWDRVDRAVRDLGSYDWVVFTSSNGVEIFLERLRALKKDVRVFGRAKIAAIGPATAERLAESGLRADFVPARYVSESLAAEFKRREKLAGKKILLLRADIARDYLRKALSGEGARVDNVAVYRTVPEPGNGARMAKMIAAGEVDYVTFTSSSTVDHFVNLIGRRTIAGIRRKTRWVSIGPVTSRTARNYGLRIYRQARPYTLAGLIRSILGG
jgi:uroporphyrinogen III methyltransferase/synthase